MAARVVVNCSNTQEAGIYSFHPGGGHALSADGSVHFVSANVDAGAFAAACTKVTARPAPVLPLIIQEVFEVFSVASERCIAERNRSGTPICGVPEGASS